MANKITKYKKKDGKTYYKIQAYLGMNAETGKEINVTRQGFASKKDAEMGREPRDKAEVTAWVNAAVAQAEALYPTTENKPDPELRTVGGVRYWVTTF